MLCFLKNLIYKCAGLFAGADNLSPTLLLFSEQVPLASDEVAVFNIRKEVRSDCFSSVF